MIRSIAHPTDFSPEGMLAFAHALKLALVNRSSLDLLHVRSPGDAKHWEDFPHVREYLERWGILPVGSKLGDVADKTGVKVSKVEIADADPVDGLSRYLSKHRPDLIVMASHGRSGLNRWMAGSVSADVAQRSRAPTLLFGPLARPFVDNESGELALDTILVPVDHAPPPQTRFRCWTPSARNWVPGWISSTSVRTRRACTIRNAQPSPCAGSMAR